MWSLCREHELELKVSYAAKTNALPHLREVAVMCSVEVKD